MKIILKWTHTKHNLSTLVADHNYIKVCGDIVFRSDVIKLIGAWLVSKLNHKTHISRKCHTAMFNLQRIKYICKYLTEKACQRLLHSLVMSHLCYTNSLFIGLPDIEINNLQHVQNAAVKLMTRRTKYNSWTQCFIDLHWLLIRERIIHKILTLVYNTIDDKSPAYLQDLIVRYQPPRAGVRSENG